MAGFSLNQLGQFLLGQLLDNSAQPWLNPDLADQTITQVVIDNREVQPGALFIALKGQKIDGHKFVNDALERGAVAALVSDVNAALETGALPDRLVAVPDCVAALGQIARGWLRVLRDNNPALQVVGVTGSAGKTTTKDLLARICKVKGQVVAPAGSFNNEIGLPLTVLRCEKETDYLVLEMGADHIGNIEYLCSVAPLDAAAVLLVANAHLEMFGSLENVARAKQEIIAGVENHGPVVFNYHCPAVRKMASQISPSRVNAYYLQETGDLPVQGNLEQAVVDDVKTSVSLKSPVEGVFADPAVLGWRVWANNLELDNTDCPHFQVNMLAPGEKFGAQTTANLHLKLSGRHQVFNALAALTMALTLGFSAQEALEQLENAVPDSVHRMDIQELTNPVPFLLIDDSYNANPDSMAAGIAAAQRIYQRRQAEAKGASGGRLLAVLGQMRELGQASAQAHKEIGEKLAQLGFHYFLALGEEAKPLAAMAQARGVAGKFTTDLQQAALEIKAQIKPQDVLLVKGSNGSNAWQIANMLMGKTPWPTLET